MHDLVHPFPVTPEGAFLIKCEGVKYGFFGNLEVISKTAFSMRETGIEVFDISNGGCGAKSLQ